MKWNYSQSRRVNHSTVINVLKRKCSQKKKKAINRNRSWLLLESLILTTCNKIMVWFYHHQRTPFQKGLLSSGWSDPSSYSLQELGKGIVARLPRPCGSYADMPWVPDLIWESPGGGKVEIRCSCWQKWCRYFLPVLPPCQLEAESMSYGGCFRHPSAAHITASLELERSQRLMRIPFSWMNSQDEGSSYWLWTPLNSVSGHLLKCFKVTGLLGFWANRLLYKDLPKQTNKQTKAKAGREPRGEGSVADTHWGPDIVPSAVRTWCHRKSLVGRPREEDDVSFVLSLMLLTLWEVKWVSPRGIQLLIVHGGTGIWN